MNILKLKRFSFNRILIFNLSGAAGTIIKEYSFTEPVMTCFFVEINRRISEYPIDFKYYK